MPTRAYELMIIVDQDADDAANKAVVDRVKEMVEADYAAARRDTMVKLAGFRAYDYNE